MVMSFIALKIIWHEMKSWLLLTYKPPCPSCTAIIHNCLLLNRCDYPLHSPFYYSVSRIIAHLGDLIASTKSIYNAGKVFSLSKS